MNGKQDFIFSGLAALLVAVSATGAWAARSTFLAPKLEKSVPALALGDGAAHLKGTHALGTNPGGLALTPRMEMTAQYNRLLLETQAGNLSLALPTSLYGDTVFGLSYVDLRSGGFEGRDELGRRTSSFKTQDQIFGVYAARSFSMESLLADSAALDFNPLQIGAGFKLIRSGIAGFSATAFALDLGVQYALGDSPFSFGLAFLNLGSGPRFTKGSEGSKLPTQINLGSAYQLAAPVMLVGALNRHVHEGKTEVVFGVQYQAGQILALRGRYAFTQGGIRESRNAALLGFAGGFGVEILENSSLDYAFTPINSELGSGIHRFSFTMRFGKASAMDLRTRRSYSGEYQKAGEERTKSLPGESPYQDDLGAGVIVW